MALGLHTLNPASGSKKTRKRVGRGLGSTGTYAGRGAKGQKSRSGVSGLKRLGMKRLVLSQPKNRGFKSLQEKVVCVTLGAVAKLIKEKKIVSPATLKDVGLIGASVRRVKILGTGEVSSVLTVKECQVTASARKKIEAAGGSIV